ncbi:MAG: hypothetical protein H6839_00820 [Planctomycetes bacterium]|nr:hypothetical protein [Planctomycetota bacterium]
MEVQDDIQKRFDELGGTKFLALDTIEEAGRLGNYGQPFRWAFVLECKRPDENAAVPTFDVAHAIIEFATGALCVSIDLPSTGEPATDRKELLSRVGPAPMRLRGHLG